MSTILVLNSSVYGDASVTRTLVAETVRRLQAADPDARVLEHDLGATPLPRLSTANLSYSHSFCPERHHERWRR